MQTCTLEYFNRIASGDLLIVGIGIAQSPTAMTFSVSDSEAPTAVWHQGSPTCEAGYGVDDACADAWYAQATASGADIISITENGSDYGVLHFDIEEWSGISPPYAASPSYGLCSASCTGNESTSPAYFPASPHVAFAATDSATGGFQIYAPGSYFALDAYDLSAAWEYSTSISSPTTFQMSLSGTTYDTWADSGIVVYEAQPQQTASTVSTTRTVTLTQLTTTVTTATVTTTTTSTSVPTVSTYAYVSLGATVLVILVVASLAAWVLKGRRP